MVIQIYTPNHDQSLKLETIIKEQSKEHRKLLRFDQDDLHPHAPVLESQSTNLQRLYTLQAFKTNFPSLFLSPDYTKSDYP